MSSVGGASARASRDADCGGGGSLALAGRVSGLCHVRIVHAGARAVVQATRQRPVGVAAARERCSAATLSHDGASWWLRWGVRFHQRPAGDVRVRHYGRCQS